MHRSVFTLATVMMLLFFLLSNFDRFFFTLHFLESLIFLVMLLLLYYDLDEWAYVVGIVTPLFWMVLTLLQGASLGGLRALARALAFQGIKSPADFIGGLLFITSVGLVVASAVGFRREVWGMRGALRTALLGSLLVGAYYAVLIFTLIRLASPER